MLGKKSITLQKRVNGKTITIQADKLHRICDIVYSNNDKSKRQTVLNFYKGRQLDDKDVQYSILQFMLNLENRN